MGQTDPTNVLSTVAAATRIPLRVLLVDDSEVDVELVVKELRCGGYEPTWERVDTAAALTAALDREPWDVITCDWVMPQFSGPAALALLQERQVDLPIIIVSGQVGEEYAVTAMKAGAHDFVSKHRLARLCPAIARELKETQVRWEHKQAGKALATAHEQLRFITDNMLDMLSFVSVDAVFQYVSSSHQRILGYAPEDLLGRSAFDFFHPEDVALVRSAFEAGIKNRTLSAPMELRHRHADGHYVWLEAVGRPFFDAHGSVGGVVVNGRDITERKQAELEYRTILQTASDGFWILDVQGNILDVNEAYCQLSGYNRAELLTMNVRDIEAVESASEVTQHIRQVMEAGHGHFEVHHRRKDGRVLEIAISTNFRDVSGGRFFVFLRDITARKRADGAMRLQSEIVRDMAEGVCLVSAEGLRIVYTNPKMEEMFGYAPDEMNGKHVSILNAPIGGEPMETARQIEKALTESGAWRGEVLNMKKDGTSFWSQASISMSDHPEYGKVYVSLQMDITERKHIEAVLRESEERLRLAQQAAQVVIWDWNLLSGMATWSSPVASQLGLPSGSFDGTYKGFLAFVHPEDREYVRQTVDRAISEGADYDVELRLMSPDGSVRWAASRGHTLRDSSGQAVRMLGVSKDITYRKLAEEALYVTQFSMDHAGDVMFWTNAEGRFLYVNHAASDRLGYSREQLLTMHVWDVDPDYSIDRWPAHWEELKEKGTLTFETRQRRHDGTIFPAELTVKYLQHGELKYACTSARDITERKRAEDELEFRNSLLSTLQEASIDGIVVVDEADRIISFNKRFVELWGIPSEVLATRSGEQALRFLVDKVVDSDWFIERIHHLYTQRQETSRDEIRLKDGRTLDRYSAPVCRADGTYYGRVGYYRDITDRLRAERLALDQFKLAEAFFNHSVSCFVVLDRDYKFVRVNEAYASSCRRDISEFTGRNHFDMYPSDAKDIFDDVVRTKRQFTTFNRAFVFPDQPERGVTYWDWTLVPILDQHGEVEYLVFSLNEVTERKRAEMELQALNVELERRVAERTRQLEAANQELEAFSYSVSHDLRAPLRAVDGFSTMLLDRYGPQFDAQGHHYLQRVREGTQRMGELINDLLGLSRITCTEMHRQPVDLSALARTIVADLRKTQPERQIEFVIADGVVVKGDAGLLRAALENLLSNGWKYTSKHPKARIEFGVSQQDGQPVYFVRDDGARFDMAYVGKLFGAFQRLHAADDFEGSGIGLATVQRVIHRHGGRLWAEGAVERGATFYFTLPEAAVHH